MNFEEAKQILSSSGKTGRLILKGGSEWEIEYLPERKREYEQELQEKIEQKERKE